jgi:polyisoprenoid-binding protein YceI
LRAAGTLLAVALLLAPAAAPAAEGTFSVDPAASTVRFTLEATLHTVEGEGRVQGGEIHFYADGGAASGAVRVDAQSFRTGIEARDDDMHEQVLESGRFPEIRFTAERLEVRSRSADAAEVTIHGKLALHGAEHDVAVPAHLALEGGALHVTGAFTVPYVAWGLRDLSTFVLRVAKEVEVQLELRGALQLEVQ